MIGEDTSSTNEPETIEVKALRMRDEISIWDLSIPSKDFEAFYDAEPEVEAADFWSQEESQNEENEEKPMQEELFFDFHNQKPR